MVYAYFSGRPCNQIGSPCAGPYPHMHLTPNLTTTTKQHHTASQTHSYYRQCMKKRHDIRDMLVHNIMYSCVTLRRIAHTFPRLVCSRLFFARPARATFALPIPSIYCVRAITNKMCRAHHLGVIQPDTVRRSWYFSGGDLYDFRAHSSVDRSTNISAPSHLSGVDASPFRHLHFK